MSHPSASAPPRLLLPRVERIREVRVFLHITPWPCKKGVYLKRLDLRSIRHHAEKSSKLARKNHSDMASTPSSSSRPCGPEKGEWEKWSVSHGELEKLQIQGFLPPTDQVPVRAGLTAPNGEAQAKNFPNPSEGERVCFVPYLLRGVGFPIHPFLRGRLEFYGL